MGKCRLTQTIVQKAEPRKSRYFIRDDVVLGLVLRVEPSGNKRFYLDYRRSSGERTSYKLGSVDIFTVAQARDAARDLLAQVALGIDPADVRRKKHHDSLGGFIRKCYAPWVTENRKSGKATVDMILSSFSTLLEEEVTGLTPLVMEEWKVQARKAGNKASTVNRKITSLKAAINWGVKHGLLESNPFQGLETLSERDSEAKVRYLTKEEHERLLAALDAREERIKAERDRYNLWREQRGKEALTRLRELAFVDHLKPMVILSLNTGIRRNELFSLEWHDISFPHEMLTVRASNSKTDKTRHIPLNEEALEAMRLWKAQTKKRGQSLVFVSSKTGRRFNNCNSAWEEVLKAAEIHNFRWHDMRHDFASHLVMAGVDLNTVRELLGHADLKMTLRYAHLAPKVKREAVALLKR